MSEAVNVVRRMIGRRHRITQAEMVALLMAMPMDLATGSTITGRNDAGHLCVGGQWITTANEEARAVARRWADMCRGIMVVSVLPTSYYVGEELREGLGVRYDEPGSMDPNLRADVMFVPHTLSTDLGYLRKRCKRLLIVGPQS